MARTQHDAVLGVLDGVGSQQRWRLHAACGGADLDLFFPLGDGDELESVTVAKQICRGCTVRHECRDWALTSGENYGIFGGLTAAERRVLHRTQQRMTAAPT